jgi:hypothetical protein
MSRLTAAVASASERAEPERAPLCSRMARSADLWHREDDGGLVRPAAGASHPTLAPTRP